jgi:hypothetical protein
MISFKELRERYPEIKNKPADTITLSSLPRDKEVNELNNFLDIDYDFGKRLIITVKDLLLTDEEIAALDVFDDFLKSGSSTWTRSVLNAFDVLLSSVSEIERQRIRKVTTAKIYKRRAKFFQP